MKTIAFKVKKPTTPDDWVQEGAETPKNNPGRLKRLTLDISPELHARIKGRAYARGEKMIDHLRAVLEKAYPPDH